MIARFRVTAAMALVLCTALVAASDGPVAPVAPVAPVSPRQALGQLKAGNDRFARNASQPVSLSLNRRQDLALAQHPTAMVLSCADSRVPPEHIFNVGLGDLFVIRTAGEVVDWSILATVEYGAEHLNIPLLVVMGHESCGAVKAAAESKGGDAASPNLDYLVKAIQAAKRQLPQDREDIKGLVLANVEQVINDVMTHSPLLRRMVDDGHLQVVGAYYELVSGRVTFSEPVASAASAASAHEERR